MHGHINVQIVLVKIPNTKLNGNPFSGSRVVPGGQMAAQPDIKMLVVNFRNCSAHAAGKCKILFR
jgi:hypothetical protein